MSPAAREPERKILLWGFMGCGKSSVGKALAERLGWLFYDLDAVIEAEAQKSIEAIFDDDGEDHFRQREAATLLRLLDVQERTVISLGGGTLINQALLQQCLKQTLVVRLCASLDTILERTKDSNRPLLKSKSRADVERLLKAREAHYKRAHHHIDTDGLDVEAVVSAVLKTRDT